MSPLACPFFVLAALVAAAQSFCTSKHVGRTTDYPVPYEPIYFQPPGVHISTSNNCPYPMEVVGEDIKACNANSDGPAPEIDGPEGPNSPFDVTCSSSECPDGGTVYITQYCG